MMELGHGYTMDDLHRLARTAVAGAWAQAGDYVERYETAWGGIAEALYTADEPPPASRLVHAGWIAITDAALDDSRHRGLARSGGPDPVAFERFWRYTARNTPSPEQYVVEAEALHQIWPTLTPTQQRCLLALAAMGDYAAAATAVGMGYQHFHSHVRNARLRFLALWHEGEVPSGLWGSDRRRWRQDVAPSEVRRPTTVRRRAARRRLESDRAKRAAS